MAIEHEPDCDRQHTTRQRCNQNALSAGQGDVSPNGDAPAAKTAPRRRPARSNETAARRARPSASREGVEVASEEGDGSNETEPLDEIVSIREEVVAAERQVLPLAGPEPDPIEPADSAAPRGLIIAAAIFAIITAALVVLLLRSGGQDESVVEENG